MFLMAKSKIFPSKKEAQHTWVYSFHRKKSLTFSLLLALLLKNNINKSTPMQNINMYWLIISSLASDSGRQKCYLTIKRHARNYQGDD